MSPSARGQTWRDASPGYKALVRLKDYLDRIGFSGAPRADLATLRALHRQHLLSIPYENIDVLLRRPLTVDVAAAREKLIAGRRGGWCYEMNGVFGWALNEIGFDVTRVAGGVLRDVMGEETVGSHLVLMVQLDGPYLADVGFGDGLFEPTALRAGEIDQRGFVSRLEWLEEGWWRFHNHQHGGAPRFDFQPQAAQPGALEKRCAYLQSSEASPFTQNLVVQRHFSDRVEILRNSMRVTVTPHAQNLRMLESAEALASELCETFGLDVPEAPALWPLAERRGREMLADLRARTP